MGNARVGAQDSNAPLPGGAIANTSISDAELAADAVTTAKIAADAVTTAKIATDAVTTAKVASNAITTAKVANGAITSAKLLTYQGQAQFNNQVSVSGGTSISTTLNLGNLSLPSSQGMLLVGNFYAEMYSSVSGTSSNSITLTLGIAGAITSNVSVNNTGATTLFENWFGVEILGGAPIYVSTASPSVLARAVVVAGPSYSSVSQTVYFRNIRFHYAWIS